MSSATPPYDWELHRSVVCDTTGRKLTVGLFQELSDSTAPFRLADWKKVYVECADPTEYTPAMLLIGNWDHWTALLNTKSFMEHLDRWRKEVEVKLRCAAIKEIVKQSRDKKGTMAARWLAEAGFVPRDKRKPKDKQDEGETNTEVNKRINADSARLGLIRGGKE